MLNWFVCLNSRNKCIERLAVVIKKFADNKGFVCSFGLHVYIIMFGLEVLIVGITGLCLDMS